MKTIVGILAAVLALAFGVNGDSTLCAGLEDGYFVRDSNNCKGYYYCRNHIGMPDLCPGDYLFNEKTQLCDYAENVECHVCNQQTGFQISAHPQHCDQFVMCANGVSFVGKCLEGELYDDAYKTCNPAQRVSCQLAKCPEQDSPNNIVYLPGTQRCDEYFICQAGTAVQKLCAPGLYWDKYNEHCDISSNVVCAFPLTEEL